MTRAILYFGPIMLSGVWTPMLAAQLPRPALATVGRSVTLIPGVCVRIAQGDDLIFEWNPAFDIPSPVLGLQEFALSFQREDIPGQAVQGRTQFVLRANYMAERSGARNSTVTSASNGYFQMRFHIHLLSIEPGEYHLVSARTIAKLDPGYQGPQPAMTNSPLRYPFCVEVADPAGKP
jgi:hypothetical protein